ncbi:hypothetical protein [Candidatus Harpocratesius sp.]
MQNSNNSFNSNDLHNSHNSGDSDNSDNLHIHHSNKSYNPNDSHNSNISRDAYNPTQPKFIILNRIEPVKFRDMLYGQSVRFDVQKKTVKLQSQFHKPAFIQFNQIEKIIVQYNPKRKLLWWGLATILMFIGILLLYIRVRVPNWKIEIYLKNQKKKVLIRPWMTEIEGMRLANLLSPHLIVEYYPISQKL